MSNARGDDDLVELRAFLKEKAKSRAPGRAMSLKQTIAALRPELIELKDGGYTDTAIVDLLKQKNVVISAGTLKNYMSQTRDTETTSVPKRSRAIAAPGKREVTAPDTKPTPVAPSPAITPGAPGQKVSLMRDPRKQL